MNTCIRVSFVCNDFYDDDELVRCIVGTAIDYTSHNCMIPSEIKKAKKNFASVMSSNSLIKSFCFYGHCEWIHFLFSTNTYNLIA